MPGGGAHRADDGCLAIKVFVEVHRELGVVGNGTVASKGGGGSGFEEAWNHCVCPVTLVVFVIV